MTYWTGDPKYCSPGIRPIILKSGTLLVGSWYPRSRFTLHTHAHTHRRESTYLHTYTHMYVHTRTCVYVRTHTLACVTLVGTLSKVCQGKRVGPRSPNVTGGRHNLDLDHTCHLTVRVDRTRKDESTGRGDEEGKRERETYIDIYLSIGRGRTKVPEGVTGGERERETYIYQDIYLSIKHNIHIHTYIYILKGCDIRWS